MTRNILDLTEQSSEKTRKKKAAWITMAMETFSEISSIDFTEHHSYPVLLDEDVLEEVLPEIVSDRKTLVVTTPTVFSLYGTQLIAVSRGSLQKDDFLVLDCDEPRKNIEQVMIVVERAARNIDRKGLVIGFGGGVVLDIACFAASIIRRGVGFVKIPTTLIGQVDAGIGIKGGVNFSNKKSFLGCFYAPEAVLIQPSYLKTLTQTDISAGLAEMLKVAIILDSDLFDVIAQNSTSFLESRMALPENAVYDAINASVKWMLDELRPNLTECLSYERSVDFGHTFSPLLEATSAFSIPHGFAVAIDIAISSSLSAVQGTLSQDALEKILECLVAAGLPICHDLITSELCLIALREAQAHRGGHLNLIVPSAIGNYRIIRNATDVTPSQLQAALQKLRQIAKKPHTRQSFSKIRSPKT